MNPYRIGQKKGTYHVVKIKGDRLIIMPARFDLMLMAACFSLSDIVDIDAWCGTIDTAHPNSIGRFI